MDQMDDGENKVVPSRDCLAAQPRVTKKNSAAALSI